MKTINVYRVVWQCPDYGIRQSWYGTRANAESARELLEDDTTLDFVSIRQIKMPITKNELLHWLNKYCDGWT